MHVPKGAQNERFKTTQKSLEREKPIPDKGLPLILNFIEVFRCIKKGEDTVGVFLELQRHYIRVNFLC